MKKLRISHKQQAINDRCPKYPPPYYSPRDVELYWGKDKPPRPKGGNINLSKVQEKRNAKAVRGKRHPGSGCHIEKKGDFSSRFFVGECKRSDGKGIRITTDI